MAEQEPHRRAEDSSRGSVTGSDGALSQAFIEEGTPLAGRTKGLRDVGEVETIVLWRDVSVPSVPLHFLLGEKVHIVGETNFSFAIALAAYRHDYRWQCTSASGVGEWPQGSQDPVEACEGVKCDAQEWIRDNAVTDAYNRANAVRGPKVRQVANSVEAICQEEVDRVKSPPEGKRGTLLAHRAMYSPSPLVVQGAWKADLDALDAEQLRSLGPVDSIWLQCPCTPEHVGYDVVLPILQGFLKAAGRAGIPRVLIGIANRPSYHCSYRLQELNILEENPVFMQYRFRGANNTMINEILAHGYIYEGPTGTHEHNFAHHVVLIFELDSSGEGANPVE